MMYCAQTPELPHNTAAIRTFSIPFLVEPIFSSSCCFIFLRAGIITELSPALSRNLLFNDFIRACY
ncbi:hypothetical protein B1R64_09480 [Salmonella enterica subsp. enterica serovar Weltevreden]|nr:hypothetical protein B1R69_18800 [Salmonella enterica subsp. enterica serovar Weltevreden]PRT90048.1 hypothetical protein B1R58_08790 [Salmonella enterica subsp. enterica serovar Weltevreden]PRT93283.1 hypothetical protein B1R47_04680 [Salmonella enterica subsp. enterica serovar Weltevreden]PRU02026.1 hypothetical protein B1R86_10680 [Salmonella enterica subsp. enterica serovar Weltevreden]PRU05916.1 hypothetical protein B1R80_05440 [Salmonella enterica subsp. enterica serovar Weltevreden]